MEYTIRKAQPSDLEAVTAVEAACFPPAEAAGAEDFQERLKSCAESFFVAEDKKGRILGFVNGCCADTDELADAFYHDKSLHNPEGAYQMIFGLNVLPEYRRQGLGELLMRHMLTSAGQRGKKAVILTCKEHMVAFYARIGYRFEGLSDSSHGGAVWYKMRFPLEKKKLWHDHVVQYYETDQMGIAHHSNYIRWLEEARMSFFRAMGSDYLLLEKEGIVSPVLSINIKYKAMSYVEDEIRIQVKVQKYDGIRLEVAYELLNRTTGAICCEATSSHCFVNRQGRPVSLKKSCPKMHEVMLGFLEN